jgi:hypothetical protein
MSQQSKYSQGNRNQAVHSRQQTENEVGSQPPPHKVANFTQLNQNSGANPAGFVANSNLSTFLLKKGSSTSLHTHEHANEYSYQINLSNVNPGYGENQLGSNEQSHASQHTFNNAQAERLPARKGPAKNNLFQEVIVEDENETNEQQKHAYRSRLSAHHEPK